MVKIKDILKEDLEDLEELIKSINKNTSPVDIICRLRLHQKFKERRFKKIEGSLY